MERCSEIIGCPLPFHYFLYSLVLELANQSFPNSICCWLIRDRKGEEGRTVNGCVLPLLPFLLDSKRLSLFLWQTLGVPHSQTL